MKKILTILLTMGLFLVLGVCGGCGASTKEPPAEEAPNEDPPAAEAPGEEIPGEEIVLRFSTAATPGSTTVDAMEVFKKAIEESTNGQIQIEIYHSSSLFAQDAEMEAVINGNLDMATGGDSWLSPYYPSLSMFSAAYFIESVEHMNAVLNGEIGDNLFADVGEQIGALPLGAWYDGARTVSLRFAEPQIKTPNDLKGVILRMPNSDSWLFMGEALGANPTPLAFAELYTSLNTGAIDAQDNPLPNLESSKCYEVTKQISLTNHLIGSVWPVINKAKWDSLGADLQDKMIEALDEAGDYMETTNLEKEARLLEFFESEGIVIVEPDKQTFIDYVEEKYLNSELVKTWDMDLYEKVKNMA